MLESSDGNRYYDKGVLDANVHRWPPGHWTVASSLSDASGRAPPPRLPGARRPAGEEVGGGDDRLDRKWEGLASPTPNPRPGPLGMEAGLEPA